MCFFLNVINAKVLLPKAYVNLADIGSIFIPFGFLAPKTFNLKCN